MSLRKRTQEESRAEAAEKELKIKREPGLPQIEKLSSQIETVTISDDEDGNDVLYFQNSLSDIFCVYRSQGSIKL